MTNRQETLFSKQQHVIQVPAQVVSLHKDDAFE